MRCSSCGAENPEGLKFCNECAAPFKRRCGTCGFENAPTAKFCGECAARLNTTLTSLDPAKTPTSDAVRIAAQADSQTIIEGERKTVTALFADIKGSTELMADLDPEAARAIVDPALRLMIDAVHRYDGYIVQSTGDGVFALFGAPVAHEDHPQRALYAALRMQEELRRYAGRLRAQGGVPIEARIGANTGEVVVRSIHTDEGHAEYTPIGHTTNLASRMQVVAPTGSIAIGEATRKLVEGYFLLKALGPTLVKGVAEPVNVYEVTGLGPLRTRLQRAAGRGLTRFVGREAELAQMRRALELAREGHGQIVAAMGDPGVGKSRLVFEFKAIAQSGCLVLEAYSVSHGKASAYLPVIDLLRSYFEIAPEDDERKRREKVNGKIITLDRSLEDTLPYLFGLLGIVEGDDPLAQLDPQLRRRRTLESIKRILARESLNQPLIVIFEDLHWIDSETQALLNLLVDGIATARILLLVNYRPEYHHQWGNKTYYTQLRLDPLGKESAQEMLTVLLGGDNEGILPLMKLVIVRTEGNPFFMEEIVQSLFEQGVLARNGAAKLVKPLNEIRVPPTVQAILASRIDRLPAAEKELLQTLAVLGREFPAGLIRGVTAKPDAELEHLLAGLQLAEFIYEQPVLPDVEYRFKHALTQEVAYNSMLTERRRLFHERAGKAIEALFARQLDEHLAELARHYDRGGDVRKAVVYAGRAGHRAAQQTAHPEAINYFTRAVQLLARLPEGADRDREELDLQMALAWSWFVARGRGAPEREPILLRAIQLCEQQGDEAKLTQALLSLASFRVSHRQYPAARQLGERALALAEKAKEPALIAAAHCHLGTVFFLTGQFQSVREHCERAVNLFGPGPWVDSLSVEYAIRATGFLSVTSVFLGYPATALKRVHELLDSVRRLSDPFALAYALFVSQISAHLAREGRTQARWAEELFSISTEHEMRGYLIHSYFSRGLAMVLAGRAEEAVAEVRRAIAETAASGVPPGTPFRVGLAEACAQCGHQAEGLAAIAEALDDAERTGERQLEAEAHRLKGELLLIGGNSDETEAERCFRTAIDIARDQRAKWLELRATTSLARLLQRQGKTGEAGKMLAQIYGWFTEGFEFADLKDAKGLRDELSARQTVEK